MSNKVVPMPKRRRQTIEIDANIEAMADGTIEALAKEPVFQRGGKLVHIVRDATVADRRLSVDRKEGTPRIKILPEARLRELCGRGLRFTRRNKQGESYEVPPPKDLAVQIAARGQWRHIRILTGVVTCPVMRPDGTILNEPGYDAATGLLYAPSIEVELIEEPTRRDAERALQSLYDVVGDFPFKDDRHRAAWVSTLLSLLARPAIDGPVPLLLIDASTRGSGKTKLADLISVIATGREVPRRPQPRNSDEWRKAMLGIGLAADALILFDNVTSVVGGESLDMVLTGNEFRDRLLSKNEEITVEIRTVFMVSGNNAQPTADIVRRAIQVRLEPDCERPEQRDDFEHPDLLRWVKEERPRLVADALTILRAFQLTEERPTLKAAGSFESWSAVVREAVVWSGGLDPIETQKDLEAEDSESANAGTMLAAWHEEFGDAYKLSSEVLKAVNAEGRSEAVESLRGALLQLVPDKGGNVSSTRFPKHLGKHRDRIIGGFTLRRAKARTRCGHAWAVLKVGKQVETHPANEGVAGGGMGQQSHPQSGEGEQDAFF